MSFLFSRLHLKALGIINVHVSYNSWTFLHRKTDNMLIFFELLWYVLIKNYDCVILKHQDMKMWADMKTTALLK